MLLGWKVPVPTSGSMDYALSFRPEYHQAILDVIIHYGWKKVIYIYDSHDGECLYTFQWVSFARPGFPWSVNGRSSASVRAYPHKPQRLRASINRKRDS